MACTATADQHVVCTTPSIVSYTVRQILSLAPLVGQPGLKPLFWKVPIFQRRYCWLDIQFEKLLHDCLRLSAEGSRSHELGRIMVAVDSDGDLLLLDGQQRMTTICLMISSIRDYLLAVAQEDSSLSPSDRSSLVALSGQASQLLWRDGSPILEVTYFDRASFLMCIDNRNRDEDAFQNSLTFIHAGPRDNIMKCRAFFDRSLRRGLNASELGVMCPSTAGGQNVSGRIAAANLLGSLLDRISMLYFQVVETNVQTVYERLAMREALISKGCYNNEPGVSMSEADLVRNLVVSYGCGATSQRAIYESYWAVIERAAMDAGHGADLTATLGDFVSSFLSYRSTAGKVHNPDSSDVAVLSSVAERNEKDLLMTDVRSWFDPGMTFFPVYKAMRDCLNKELVRNGLPTAMAQPTLDAETVVISLLNEMVEFGSTYRMQGRPEPILAQRIASGKCRRAIDCKSSVCPCYSRGTLCVDCIVKKCANQSK